MPARCFYWQGRYIAWQGLTLSDKMLGAKAHSLQLKGTGFFSLQVLLWLNPYLPVDLSIGVSIL